MLAFQVYRLPAEGVDGFRDGHYLDHREFIRFCRMWDVKHVEILHASQPLPDDLRALAEGLYANGTPREGIVIRPFVEQAHYGERVSVKVINLAYQG